MQKFHKGDFVLAAQDRHFTADCEAVVISSDDEEFGGSDDEDDEDDNCREQHQYTVYLKDAGEMSWYDEGQLMLLETGRHDKLKEWRAAAKADAKQKSDLDWIFANGSAVLEHSYGASIQALANGVGLTNLWGRNGEGITYGRNATLTLSHAAPYLKTGDKAGWLAHCELLKANDD